MYIPTYSPLISVTLYREGRDLDANKFDYNTLAEYVKKGQLDVSGDQNSPELPKDFKVVK